MVSKWWRLNSLLCHPAFVRCLFVKDTPPAAPQKKRQSRVCLWEGDPFGGGVVVKEEEIQIEFLVVFFRSFVNCIVSVEILEDIFQIAIGSPINVRIRIDDSMGG